MKMENKFKIILLGDFSVGKTSLIKRFVENAFDERYLTTIGVRVSKKDVEFSRNNKDENATILIWDVAGNDGLSNVMSQYIRGSYGAIIAGDVTRKETLECMCKYYTMFREICPGKPAVFALNKTDLLDGNISYPEHLEKFRTETEKTTGNRVIYTSAKTGESVERLFTEIAVQMTAMYG